MTTDLCACGQPLHYQNVMSEYYMRKIVADVGEYVDVTLTSGGGTYRVPRHYIALHGLKGAELPELSKRLGFKRIR